MDLLHPSTAPDWMGPVVALFILFAVLRLITLARRMYHRRQDEKANRRYHINRI
jgi:hypothetical protein